MIQHDRSWWPDWVRIGLWGIHSRALVWVFIVLSLLLAVASNVAAYLYWGMPAVGNVFVLAALWYFFAMRWVDENAEW